MEISTSLLTGDEKISSFFDKGQISLTINGKLLLLQAMKIVITDNEESLLFTDDGYIAMFTGGKTSRRRRKDLTR